MKLSKVKTVASRFSRLSTMPVLGAALLAVVSSGSADAQSQKVTRGALWTDIGASERVDFSGRLHMLSQRIAASSCNMEAGVEPDVSLGILAGSADEIDRIMKALEFGNPQMKIIGQEDSPRILGDIREIDAQWMPVRDKISSMLEDRTATPNFRVFEDWNVPFLQNAQVLVSEIAARYSDPADLLQGDAILVDLSGRQRMRTQLLLKQACEIWNGDNSPKALAALTETIDLFDRTLAALRFGAEDVGIEGAPNAQIETALDEFASEWEIARATLQKVAEGHSIDASEASGVYMQLNQMLIESNAIVGHYTKFAKHLY